MHDLKAHLQRPSSDSNRVCASSSCIIPASPRGEGLKTMNYLVSWNLNLPDEKYLRSHLSYSLSFTEYYYGATPPRMVRYSYPRTVTLWQLFTLTAIVSDISFHDPPARSATLTCKPQTSFTWNSLLLVQWSRRNFWSVQGKTLHLSQNASTGMAFKTDIGNHSTENTLEIFHYLASSKCNT